MKKGQSLKKQGMEQAMEHAGNWTDSMLDRLKAFCKVRKDLDMSEFRMEEFRAVALVSQWDAPPTPNCWGALAAAAVKQGIIKSTDKYVKAQSPATRAHPVLVWMAA